MRTAKPKSVGDVRTAFDTSTGPTSGSAPVRRLDDRDAVEPRATMAQPASVVTVEPVAFVQRIDDNLLHWSVVEVDAAIVPGARGSHCLVFTREDCVRRVWDYPADWQSLDDEGLAVLSWHC